MDWGACVRDLSASGTSPINTQALRVLSLHCERSPDVERNDRVPYITKAQKTVTNPANQINHSYVEVCVVCASRRKQHVMLLLIGCMLTKWHEIFEPITKRLNAQPRKV